MTIRRADLAALAQVLIPLFAVLCVLVPFTADVALLTGIMLALLLGNPWAPKTRPWIPKLLGGAIVGLGAGTNFAVVTAAGSQGILITFCSLCLTIALGLALGRWMKIQRDTTLLVSVGTAICGGSAIAAIAAVMKSKQEEVSVSLATVFCLNAVALYLFPQLGWKLGLSPQEFGLWSALAIHDTSSVVGAAVSYSADSVPIATTVKLARALWIAPVAVVIAAYFNRGGGGSKRNLLPPWFLFGFIAMAAVTTWFPVLDPTAALVNLIAKRALVLTLFLIGSHLTRDFLLKVGARPLALGLILWIVASSTSLIAVRQAWITPPEAASLQRP